MPTFTTLASDTFPGASLDANWTQVDSSFIVQVDTGAGGIRGQYGEQPSPSPGTHAWARYTGTMTSLSDDQFSTLTSNQWTGYSSTAGLGAVVQAPAGTTRTGYELYVVSSTGVANIYKWSANSRTLVAGPVTLSLAANDTVTLGIIGGALAGYKNGTAISGLTYTDSSPLTGGRPAVSAASNGPYGIDWAGGNAAASGGAATSTTLTGPSTGTVGAASSNFTSTLSPGGSTSSGVIITPSDGGGGGTFSPTTVTLSTGTPSATFTYAAGSAGAKTISVTNNGGLSNPASLTYTASASSVAAFSILDWVNNAGTSLANTGNINISFHNTSTRAMVLYLTGQTINSSGHLTGSNAALTTGSTYTWVAESSTDATAFGAGRVTAT